MAIVHVVLKSSSTAPPSKAHAQYIAREGSYAKRGEPDLVESGNMPEFAKEDPLLFWAAADTHERKNGRAYTELQLALPRELGAEEQQDLARAVVREFLGERFAYTLAIHTPLAKDNIDQPHLHLMFSERAIDETTRTLAEDRFFKRNGAKKDPAWNDRDKPLEIREKWCAMMNAALERADADVRVDPRSWQDQGRDDLHLLREPKSVHRDSKRESDEGVAIAAAIEEEIAQKRAQRAELPPTHLDGPAVMEMVERKTDARIAEVQERAAEELSQIDKLIAELWADCLELLKKTGRYTAAIAKALWEKVFGTEEPMPALPIEEEELASPTVAEQETKAPSPEPDVMERWRAYRAAPDREQSRQAELSIQAKLADGRKREEERTARERQAAEQAAREKLGQKPALERKRTEKSQDLGR